MGFFAIHSPTVLWFTLPVLLYIGSFKVVSLVLTVVNVIEVKTVFIIGKIPISVRSNPLRLSFLRFSSFRHYKKKGGKRNSSARFTALQKIILPGEKGVKNPFLIVSFFFLFLLIRKKHL